MVMDIISLVLLGLGVQSYISHPSVLGVETVQNTIASQLINTTESSTTSGVQLPVQGRTKQEIQKERERLEEIKLTSESEHIKKRDVYKSFLATVKSTGDYKKTISKLREYHDAESSAYTSMIKARMNLAALNSDERQMEYTDIIATFKDSNKKAKIERIASQLGTLVQKHKSNMLSTISKMETILIENMVQVLERANGKDTTKYIASAQQSLQNLLFAKEDVAEVAGKSYVIQLTKEANVKNDIQTTLKTTIDDLTYTQTMIRNARVVMSNMIQERARLLGETVPVQLTK